MVEEQIERPSPPVSKIIEGLRGFQIEIPVWLALLFQQAFTKLAGDRYLSTAQQKELESVVKTPDGISGALHYIASCLHVRL